MRAKKSIPCQIFFYVSQKLLFFKNSTFSVSVRRRANFHLNFLLIRETGYICWLTLIPASEYIGVSLHLSITIDPWSSATQSCRSVKDLTDISFHILRGIIIFPRVRKRFKPDTSILNYLYMILLFRRARWTFIK